MGGVPIETTVKIGGRERRTSVVFEKMSECGAEVCPAAARVSIDADGHAPAVDIYIPAAAIQAFAQLPVGD
jgi:hypothetical protein